MISKPCSLHKYDSIGSHSNLHNKVAIGTESKSQEWLNNLPRVLEPVELVWQNKELYRSSCYTIFHSINSDMRERKIKSRDNWERKRNKEKARSTLGSMEVQNRKTWYFSVPLEGNTRRVCWHVAREGDIRFWWSPIIRDELTLSGGPHEREQGKTFIIEYILIFLFILGLSFHLICFSCQTWQQDSTPRSAVICIFLPYSPHPHRSF